jgi:hypothetical protein
MVGGAKVILRGLPALLRYGPLPALRATLPLKGEGFQKLPGTLASGSGLWSPLSIHGEEAPPPHPHRWSAGTSPERAVATRPHPSTTRMAR